MSATSELLTATGTVACPGLAVVLRRRDGGAVLAREPVRSADLADAVSEAWRECILRRGHLMVGHGDLALRVVPVPAAGEPSRLTGYALEAGPPEDGGAPGRCEFTIHSLEPVASRAATRLVQAGVLEAGDETIYGLEVDAAPFREFGPDPADPGGGIEVTHKNPPIHFLRVPLAPLLAEARSEGEHRSEAFPVFYTEDAREKAEQFSRQGAVDNPRFESGGVLVGPLCTCPETGALFVVVTDVFKVTDAESSLVSLEYSGKSWARIQTVVRARQKSEPAVRVLGQAHGHNFAPNDGKACEKCPSLEVCNVHNVFASPDDRAWTRAVFSRQPWSICHIFGLTVRGDKVQGLFTQHDARLLERRYFILPGFDSWNHPTLQITNT